MSITNKLTKIVSLLGKQIVELRKQNEMLLGEFEELESANNKPLCESFKFYTNLASLKLFRKIHEIIAPLIKRRHKEKNLDVTPRNFINTPKKLFVKVIRKNLRQKISSS